MNFEINFMQGWTVAPRYWRTWLKPRYKKYGAKGRTTRKFSWLGFVVFVTT